MTESEKRISDAEVKIENVRQRAESNTHRIDSIEEEVKENRNLIVAIKELAMETKSMREDLNKTIDRLSKLEKESVSEDAEKWKKFTWYVFTAVIGIIVGYVATQLGLR